MKIQKILFGFGILATTLISCDKKDVLLPKADKTVIKDLVDHSPVYLFFETNGADTLVEVNRRNTISSTNWVFNIDKRLPLKLVIPEVMQLQEKKKNSSHNREDSMTLYSYADSIGSNLAFLPFTDVKYLFDNEFSKFYIKRNAEMYMPYHNFTINFNKDNQITVDGNEMERSELPNFIKEFSDFMSEGKTTILHLNFDSSLSYEQYIQNKILVWGITDERIQLSSYEFIYDLKKLPACDCKL